MALTSTAEARSKVLETMCIRHIRVGVLGNVDAGKSTLIGTLKTSTLDDGRGLCRTKIMKHQHEKDTGRTSTISEHPVHFDQGGNTLEYVMGGDAELALQSSRIVSLMDLAGHEKYFKSTVTGMSMGMADYAVILVNGAQLPTHMTLHHIRLCIACGIPPIIVITKVRRCVSFWFCFLQGCNSFVTDSLYNVQVDSCPAQVLQKTKKKVTEIIRSPEFGKRQFAITNGRDVDTVRDKLHSLVPVFTVSCVTGEGLDLLKQLLFTLPKRRHHEVCRYNLVTAPIHDPHQNHQASLCTCAFRVTQPPPLFATEQDQSSL